MADKPWGGRFGERTDRRVEEFTESISFDRRLFEHDIRGSIAHAEMLAHVGLLTPDECQQIVRGLTEIRAEIVAGKFPFVLEREDIHMHVEAALIDRIGDVGRKLHTARSRNDQVATDVKLWTRDALDRIEGRLAAPASRLREGGRAASGPDPPRLHPHAAGAAGPGGALLPRVRREARARPDAAGRLPEAAQRAAARRSRRWRGRRCRSTAHQVASALGFEGVAANSLDVSNDRDFLIESVFVLTMIAEHLAGWAEEWVIWSHPGVLVPGAAGRALHRQQHHAAEEEPGRAGADPRPVGPGDRGTDDPAGAGEGPAARV